MAYLRRRPWLVSCLMLVVVAIWLLAGNSFPTLLFWAGILALLGAGLTATAGEAALRRGQTGVEDGPRQRRT